MLTGPENFRPGIPGFAEFADVVTSVMSPPSFLNPFCGPLYAYQSRVRPSSVYEVEDAVQSIRLREGRGMQFSN